MGDGFIQDGVMLWGPHTAVATTRGMALWNGLDVGRRALVPARGVYFRADWGQIRSYWLVERAFPDRIGWEPEDVITFDVPASDSPGRRMWLVVRKNLDFFVAAADEAGVPQREP